MISIALNQSSNSTTDFTNIRLFTRASLWLMGKFYKALCSTQMVRQTLIFYALILEIYPETR